MINDKIDIPFIFEFGQHILSFLETAVATVILGTIVEAISWFNRSGFLLARGFACC